MGLPADFRAVFDRLPMASFVLRAEPDGAAHLEALNEAFVALVGVAPEAVLGQRVEDLVTPERRDWARDTVLACLAGRDHGPWWIPLDLVRGRCVLRLEAASTAAAAGTGVFIVGTAADVTHERETPGEDRGEFTALVESSPDTVARLDLHGRYLYANATLASVVGVDQPRMVGRLPSEVDPRPVARLVEATAARCISTAAAVSTEFAFPTPEGPRHHELRVFPEYNRLGELVSVVATGRDVTDLRRRELEFTTLAEHAPAILARLDRDDRFVYLNAAIERLTGVPAAALLGTRLGGAGAAPAVAELAAALGPLAEATARVWAHETQAAAHVALPSPDGPRHLAFDLVPERGVDGAVTTVLGIGTDITDLARTTASLERINRALETLSSGNEALVRAKTEPELLAWMTRVLVEVGGSRVAWIALYDTEQGTLGAPRAWAGTGLDGPALQGLAERCARSLCPPERLRDGRARAYRGAELDAALAGWAGAPGGVALRSAVLAPLAHGAEAFGVMVAASTEADAYDDAELSLLAELADDAAYGLGTLRLRAAEAGHAARLEQAMRGTIQALASTLDVRDPYTTGHQQRVTQLAVAIGARLDLPRERLQGLELASMIHDIGKIAVPAEILTRPGRLSPLEFLLVQGHADAGHDILAGIDFPWPIAEIVRQHHERLDGSGYPRHLAGDAILPEARVLAVADVVEAMSSHRPYRPGLGVEVALAQIRADRGTLFDPEVVDACVAVFAEGAFRFA